MFILSTLKKFALIITHSMVQGTSVLGLYVPSKGRKCYMLTTPSRQSVCHKHQRINRLSNLAASVGYRQRAGLSYPSSRVQSKEQSRPKPSAFSGRKNPQHAFLRRVSKAVRPISQIYGMLTIPECYVEVGISGKIHRPQFHLWLLGSLGRRLVVKVGTSKNNKVQLHL